jgi:hypothetical protein
MQVIVIINAEGKLPSLVQHVHTTKCHFQNLVDGVTTSLHPEIVHFKK